MSLQELATEYSAAFETGDYDRTAQLLPKIKLELAKTGLIIPSKQARKEDLVAARQVLEIGVLTSIHRRDESEFSRLVAQIRPFYVPELALPQSPNERKIVALYLLLLLSKNEIAEFHTELETLEDPEQDLYLKYPVSLERWLMEGSYDKVWKAITEPSQLPAPEFAVFAESLIYTVRGEIARCAERAYASLPTSNARYLLFFSSDKEVIDFVAEQPDWHIENGRILFPSVGSEQETKSGVSAAEKLIGNTIEYAREIETII